MSAQFINPRFPSTSNKSMLGAYRKGVLARRAGEPLRACPYKAVYSCHRRNGGTWGAVYRSYWQRGWYACNHQLNGDSYSGRIAEILAEAK